MWVSEYRVELLYNNLTMYVTIGQQILQIWYMISPRVSKLFDHVTYDLRPARSLETIINENDIYIHSLTFDLRGKGPS